MEIKMTGIIKNILSVKHLWGGIVPLHLFGIYAIYDLFFGTAPTWWLISFSIGYFLMNVMGVAIGYHRLCSHRGFEVSRPVKLFLLYCGLISAQGSAIFWAGVHRGGHHKNSDTALDPHNPEDGFFHSLVLWQFRLSDGDVKVRPIVDLLRDEDITFLHKHYSTILWSIHAIVALISINLWLYFLILPALVNLYAYGLQTSVTHYSFMGYRNTETKDKSVNVVTNFPFTFGECWHNNHHADPKNPNYGRKWWELDPNYLIIKLISRRRPPL
jgi:stearoyl-CoA desaturase (delta-9 desaturase)